MSLRIGVIGFGYWGPNLVRNFSANPGMTVTAVADLRTAARDSVKTAYPSIRTFEDPNELMRWEGVDAVVVATPVGTHHALASFALDNGKHVLVEKPMCRSSAEAEDLVARSEKAGRVLMVDHTFLFTGAVQVITEIARKRQLGRICYFDSTRVNLGLFQLDVNCLWDLAPHDLSIVDHLVDSEIVDLEVSGYCHVDANRPDMVFLTAHFANNSVAHFNMSWMSPVKVRRFTIGGTSKMLVWDDLDQDQKIKIYDHGIDFQPQEQRNAIIPEYRIGDIYSPRVSRREALAGVANHFAGVIRGQETSIMDGHKGLKIVRILELADRRLNESLSLVSARRAQFEGRS